MSLIPMKMCLLKTLRNHAEEASIEDIMALMKNSYGAEKQFNYKNFYHMIQGMRSLGLVERSSVFVTENNQLEGKYVTTKSGENALKMLPKK